MGPVASCALTGREPTARIRSNKINRRFLRILEFHLVADLVIPESIRVNLEGVLCIFLREVSWPPRFRNDLVHHGQVRVDPEDRQIEWDEEHVNGSVEA